MRLTKYRPSNEIRLELSTTSMIDVVFLLLIFFLVTTTFFRPERQLKPNIKIRPQSATEDFQDIEPAIIDIILHEGAPAYRLGSTTATDIVELHQMLQRFPDKSRGAFVRVSDQVPYGMAALAVNACKQSGFVLVSILPLR